jgi:predicted PurR-regulated permease PerM
MATLSSMTRVSATMMLRIASAVALIAVGLPLWRPLLLAAVLGGTLSVLHERFSHALGNRRALSAALITIGILLVVVGPLFIMGVVLVKETIHAIAFIRHTLGRGELSELPWSLPDWLESAANDALARWSRGQHDLPTELARWPQARQLLGTAIGMAESMAHIALLAALMLVALFFLLRDGPALVDWAEHRSAMPPGRLRALLLELRGVSKSVIGAQLASGAAQAVVATIGYVISGVPSPLLFGVLSLAASFIPVGGVTAFVGLPLVALLWLMGRPGWAIFLAAWTLLLTGLVDNLIRPLIVRGGTNLPGGLVFFALLGGLLAFGPIGLVVGPLALALFLSVIAVERRDPGNIRDPGA